MRKRRGSRQAELFPRPRRPMVPIDENHRLVRLADELDWDRVGDHKVGKTVEFGLTWGIRRLRGGYLLATLATSKTDLVDARFAVRAVDDHIAFFGKPPRAYAYDRAGYSSGNLATLKSKGVQHVGLAPRGRTGWKVRGALRQKLISERAKVEGGIGTLKCPKYAFNRPAARSTAMMGACGQLAVLGYNVNKLIRELAQRNRVALVG